MKQLIKQWWNGKTVVVDDGGYVPRVAEERPWLRKLYENYPVLTTTIGSAFTGAICTEIVSRATKLFLG